MRGWPVWALPRRLRCYVIAVISISAGAIVAAAILTPWRAHDALVCGVLLAIGAVAVESVRRMGEPALAGKDAHGIWELAIALLLPPFYALAVPVAVYALTQWRVRRTLVHRRAFSAAVIGLSYGAASLVFHACWHHPDIRARLLAWALLAVACAALQWVLNYALVIAAIKLDDPAARIRDLLGGRDATAYADAAEAVIGIVVALCASSSVLVLVFVLPWAVIVERFTRRAQLKHASRTDPVTRLLTGPAWRREASVALTRTRRSGSPLALAIIGIDHLQHIGDTHGREAADSVMASVAYLLGVSVRVGDLPGRLGPQELTVLFPRASAAEALQIAERLQDTFRGIAIPLDLGGGLLPHVTTSIGLASLTTVDTDLTDLLAAADTALVRARRAGRDTIRFADIPSHQSGLPPDPQATSGQGLLARPCGQRPDR